MIAEDAGDPNASLMPIRITIPARMYMEMFWGLKKITMLPMIALKPSAIINIVFLGRRSTQTPPIGAIKTPDKTRAARIKPRVVAVPPASRTVTAKAIGNADMAIIVRIPEIIKFRYPTKERRAPGSKYFFNIFEPNAPL